MAFWGVGDCIFHVKKVGNRPLALRGHVTNTSKSKSKSKYRYVGKIVWDITPTFFTFNSLYFTQAGVKTH